MIRTIFFLFVFTFSLSIATAQAPPAAVSGKTTVTLGEKDTGQSTVQGTVSNSVTVELPGNNTVKTTGTSEKRVFPRTFEGILASGHYEYVKSNYEKALQLYKYAKTIDAGNPDSYYFIACALAKTGKYDESLKTIETALGIAVSNNKNFIARAMMKKALILEDKNDFKAAKEAWTAYLGYAQTNADARVFVDIAKSRIELVENKLKMSEKYKIVRDRLAASN